MKSEKKKNASQHDRAWYSSKIRTKPPEQSTCSLLFIFLLADPQLGNGETVEGDVSSAASSTTASDGLVTVLTDTGSSVIDTAKETTKSVEEVMKAGGRTTLAFGSMLSQLLNGMSATVATGTEYLASGVNSVDSYVNGWPVVGTLSGGVSKFVSGFSTAFSDISANGRQNRQKMFAKLREQLDQSASGGAAAATADSVAAN